MLQKLILSALIRTCLAVTIYRDIMDIMYDAKFCANANKMVNSTCSCQSSYTTYMSNENERSSCQAPRTVGCEYADFKTQQAYLISKDSLSVRISQGLRVGCREIQEILLWNLDLSSGKGSWLDVTNTAKMYFSLDVEPWHMYLVTSKLNMKLWYGHVLKIVFGKGECRNCLVLKVKGNTTYPVQKDKFMGVSVTPTTKVSSSFILKTTMVTKKILSTTALVITSTVARKTMATKKTRVAMTTQVPKSVATETAHQNVTLIPTISETKTKDEATYISTEYPLFTRKKASDSKSSTIMTALISGVSAMVTIAVFLLVLFCRQRYRNKTKHRGNNGRFNEKGDQVVGTSTKSRSWEWDAVKLLPSERSTASQSSSHYENVELDAAKYVELGKEYNFDNYQCIFGTKDSDGYKTINSNDPMSSPEYAEICSEYDNYHVIQTNSNEKIKGKQLREKSSIPTEPISSPHEYTEISIETCNSQKHAPFGAKHSLNDKSLPHSPHQYTEIDISTGGSEEGYSQGNTTNGTFPNQMDSNGTLHPYQEISNQNYEPLNHNIPSSKNSSKRLAVPEQGTYNPYDEIVPDQQKSVIKSVPVYQLQSEVGNNSLTIDGNEKEFLNPAYEQHLMITPETLDHTEQVTSHSYENYPEDIVQKNS